MADLAGLHAQAMRLILALREGIERLEATEGGLRPGDPAALARDLHQKLADLRRTSQELDSIWRMQVVRQNTAKRDIWKRKVEQVAEEADFLRTAMERFGSREQRRAAERADRQKLLERAEVGRRLKDEMDEEAAVMGHVQRSQRYLSEMYETGSSILTNMAGNRERIKAAHKKALDVINSVGLGDRVLRMIERRHKQDAWIVYGGMVAIMLFTGLLLWWAWF